MARIEEKNKRLSDIPYYILREYYSTTAAFYDPDISGTGWNAEERTQDFILYLPIANAFETISLYPTTAGSGSIITDYSEINHELDVSLTLLRWKGWWQTSGASAESEADVYIKKNSRLYNWMTTNYPLYVQTDQDMLYVGKIAEHSSSWIKIKYFGYRDLPQDVIPTYNRKEKFMVFLNVFFDRVFSRVRKKQLGLQLLRDVEEIEDTHLNRIGRNLIDDLFDETSEFYMPEGAKRLFIRELINLLKKKGTYRPLYFLWDILSWNRLNTITIRELYYSEPVEYEFRDYDKKFLDVSGAIVRGNAALDTMTGLDEVMLADGVEMNAKANNTDVPDLIMDSPAEVGVSAVGPISVLDDSWIMDSRLPGLIASDVVRKVPFYWVNISLDESKMWGLPSQQENVCYNHGMELTAGPAGTSGFYWYGTYEIVSGGRSGTYAMSLSAGDYVSTISVTGRQVDIGDIVDKYIEFFPELNMPQILPDGIFLGLYAASAAGESLSAATGAMFHLETDITFSDGSTTSVTGEQIPVSALTLGSAGWYYSDSIYLFSKNIKFITPKITFHHVSGVALVDDIEVFPVWTSAATVNNIVANSVYDAYEKFRPTSHKSYYMFTKGLSADITWTLAREQAIKEAYSIGQTSSGPVSLTESTAASAVSAVRNALYIDTYIPIYHVVLGQGGLLSLTGDHPVSGIPSGTTYYDYGGTSGISANNRRIIVTPVFEKKYYMSSAGDVQRCLVKVKIDSEDEVWFNELWLFDHEFEKLLFYSTFPKIHKPKNISVIFNIMLVVDIT